MLACGWAEKKKLQQKFPEKQDVALKELFFFFFKSEAPLSRPCAKKKTWLLDWFIHPSFRFGLLSFIHHHCWARNQKFYYFKKTFVIFKNKKKKTQNKTNLAKVCDFKVLIQWQNVCLISNKEENVFYLPKKLYSGTSTLNNYIIRISFSFNTTVQEIAFEAHKPEGNCLYCRRRNHRHWSMLSSYWQYL